MAIMAGAIESPPPANNVRTQPRLLCKGRQRKLVTKLKAKLYSALASDAKESARAERLGYAPYLITDTPGSKIERKIQDIINQCELMLTDRG